MAVKGISVGAVALMGGGLIFLWSAMHGASITGSLRDLLAGKQPAGTNVNSIGDLPSLDSANGPDQPVGGNQPVPPVTGGSNQAVLQQVAASFGWTGSEWTALYNVEMAEAGFSLTATNPSSGAYGMAQFINGPSEYAQYGGNSGTAFGQSVAMCNYIKQRYGTPSAAWAHERSFHWY